MESANDEQMINSLNQLKNEDFKTICEASLVYLNDKNKLEKLNNLNQTLIHLPDCKDLAKWLIKNFVSALKQDYDANKLSEKYQTIGLDEKKAELLNQLWSTHSDSIKNNTDNQSLMISQLVDLEWKFGVTASTNQIDKFGNVFLQLKLVLNKGGNLETSFMELTLPQFYSFLHEMNKAKSQMEYLS